jgi:hypothetical protein
VKGQNSDDMRWRMNARDKPPWDSIGSASTRRSTQWCPLGWWGPRYPWGDTWWQDRFHLWAEWCRSAWQRMSTNRHQGWPIQIAAK